MSYFAKYKNNSKGLFVSLLIHFGWWIPDRLYLKWMFKLRLGYKLNLNSPQTYNEKLQWLKLNYHNSDYTRLVDKVAVKDFVARKVGKKFVIPTIGVWDSVNDIDWDSLPNKFVVKSTNDSGGVVVCSDKNKFDVNIAVNKLRKLGGRDYSKWSKEYPYKGVPHRFIAEEYIDDGQGLIDYKFFCFDGVPRFLFVATGRQQGDVRFDFFDINFTHLPVINGHPNAIVPPKQPLNFETMLQVATKLSEGMPHVRVDLYNVNGEVYFGELTFFHWSGFVPFVPFKWDCIFGRYLKLPRIEGS